MTDNNEEIKFFFTKISVKVIKCNLCNKEYKGGLSNMRDHLVSKHADESARLNLSKRRRTQTQDNERNEQNDGEVSEVLSKMKNISIDIEPNQVI